MQEQENGCDESGTPAQNHEEALETALRETEKKKPSRRQRAYKHFSEWKNLVDTLTLVLVSLTTGFGLALWNAQIEANGINAKAYEASNRPWVMLAEIKPADLTSDDADGVFLWAKVAVKNIGHSPAQNVSVTGRLLINGFDLPPDQAMAQVCQEAKGNPLVISGRVMFPDQVQNIDGETPTAFSIRAILG